MIVTTLVPPEELVIVLISVTKAGVLVNDCPTLFVVTNTKVE